MSDEEVRVPADQPDPPYVDPEAPSEPEPAPDHDPKNDVVEDEA